MSARGKLRIWHVGNWCIHVGQEYIESPFISHTKEVELLNYAQPFIDALNAIPDAEVHSEPSWDLYRMSPEKFDERLEWATAIVFGDVETKCLMLHPDFFTRSKWGDKPITFPDRFDLLRQWVDGGGHFHMNGGWLSFSGEIGRGGWGRSRFRHVLPVTCLQHDDLIESTSGYPVYCCLPGHPIVSGIDWSTLPALLGFNEVTMREEGLCLIEIENRGKRHPLLAVGKFGQGRVSCWMTGASPHWGINFMKWQEYPRFWKQLFTQAW